MCLARRMLTSIVFLACSLFAFPALPFADSSPLLLWQDVEKLIDAHPALGAAFGQIGVAEGELRTSRQLPNPELGISAGESKELEGGGRKSIWDLELTIPLQWPGKYIYRGRAAGAAVEAARFEAKAVRLEVYRELRGLYVTIAYDQENLRLRRESERQLVKLTEITKLRVDQGEARPLELVRIEGELEELRLEIERAASEAAAHCDQLNLWLGGKLPPEFAVAVDYANLPSPPHLDDALARVSIDNPAIMAAQARRKQSLSSVSAEKHAVMPDLNIGAFWGEEFDTQNYGGLITCTIPLWDWNRGGISKAKSEARLATANSDLIAKRIKSSIIEAHGRAQNALDAIRRYQTGILPKSEKALADLETLYRAGECGLIDVLDARRALIRAQLGLNAVQFDYFSAMIELNVLTGGPDHA